MAEAVPGNAEGARTDSWHVYILLTAAGLLYTGISTDPARRLREHEAGKKGARSLRGKGPLQIVFLWPAADRSTASILEARIKGFSRTQKLQLIRGELRLEGDPAVV